MPNASAVEASSVAAAVDAVFHPQRLAKLDRLRLHLRFAVREHGTLVDRALVGDFALVDRRRLGHHLQARHARGAAGGRLPQRISHVLKEAAQGGMRQHLGQRRTGGQAGRCH